MTNLPHLDRLIRMGSLVGAVGIGGGALLDQRLETRRQQREVQTMERERQDIERRTLDLLAREAALINDPIVRSKLMVESPAFPIIESSPQQDQNRQEPRR